MTYDNSSNAFGLKNDFKNEIIWKGLSIYFCTLIEIEEWKRFVVLSQKSNYEHMRFNWWEARYAGEQIQIGGNESYFPGLAVSTNFNPPLIVNKVTVTNKQKSKNDCISVRNLRNKYNTKYNEK